MYYKCASQGVGGKSFNLTKKEKSKGQQVLGCQV